MLVPSNHNQVIPQVCYELEELMGSIHDDNSHFSFKKAIQCDELEEFPTVACHILQQWGMHYYYVPREYGGKLSSFETLFWLLRLISRRDLTIAIGHGKTYLGASPIYVGGSFEQKQQISQSIIAGKVVSLGLTERQHGADLLANELKAEKHEASYVLTGEKWLINNATRGDLIALFVKTNHQLSNTRNYSVLLVDKSYLSKSDYFTLPKIKTYGVRGADISGIYFSKAKLADSNLIGPEGNGLEIILKALQITRTLCSSLSLGAADTALRTTLEFVYNRKLYDISIGSIPYVKQILTDSYINLLVCEAVSLSVIRCLHFIPSVLSIYSSIVKYLIPSQIEIMLDNLGSLLGARSYIREELYSGIFQKCIRDNSIVGLFDGSTIINLQAISNQINFVVKKSLSGKSQLSESVLNTLFKLDNPVKNFDSHQLRLSNHGQDFLSHSFSFILTKILESSIDTEMHPDLVIILNHYINFQNNLYEEINKNDFFYEKLDKAKEKLLKQYCLLFAANCCLNVWYFNRIYFSNSWIYACLFYLLKELGCSSGLFPYSTNSIYHSMMTQFQNNKLFSIFSFKLN